MGGRRLALELINNPPMSRQKEQPMMAVTPDEQYIVLSSTKQRRKWWWWPRYRQSNWRQLQVSGPETECKRQAIVCSASRLQDFFTRGGGAHKSIVIFSPVNFSTLHYSCLAELWVKWDSSMNRPLPWKCPPWGQHIGGDKRKKKNITLFLLRPRPPFLGFCSLILI